MKKITLCLLALLFPVIAMATPVGPMNYQGRLLDNNGVPVTGSYNFKLKVYDALTNGVLKYQEDFNGVTVNDGVYAIKLGNGPKIAGDSDWDVTLWQTNLNNLFLEVEVNGEALTPRHELTSAPHAYTATLALALGDKSISDFDNILEGICVSSEGRWLAELEKCAGGDVDLSNLDPLTLAGVTDFSELEFDGANFSNASFYVNGQYENANFHGTTFKDVTFDATDFTNTDLSFTVFDGVTINSNINLSGANLTGAVFKDFDASNLDLSGAAIGGLSAGRLTACPASLPFDWTCLSYQDGPTTYYALVGPGVDLSTRTPALTQRYGGNYLSIEVFAGQNLDGANFDGVILGANFTGTILTNTNFSGAMLVDALFEAGTQLDSTNFTNSIMSWVDFKNVDLTGLSGFPTNFINAELSNVSFSNTFHDQYTDWTEAKLDSVTFTGVVGTGGFGSAHFDFLDSRLNNVTFKDSSLSLSFQDSPLNDVTFENLFYDGQVSFVAFLDPIDSPMELNDVAFTNNVFVAGGYDFSGVILRNVVFKNEDLTQAYFDGSTQLINVAFQGVDLSNNPTFGDAQLEGITDWSGSTLNGINFNGQDLTAVNFSGITAQSVDFSSAYMDGVNFSNADLSWANLSAFSMIDIIWRGATIDNAYISSNLGGTNFSGLSSAINVNWQGSQLQDADFSGLDLTGSVFNNVSLEGADFGGATVDSVTFDYASFAFADFSGVDFSAVGSLTGVDWFQTNLKNASFSGINEGAINNVIFRDIFDATNVDFSNTNYSGLRFEFSKLASAKFNGSGLNASDFYNVDLSSANFSSSDLSGGVYFFDSTLTSANFTGAFVMGVEFQNTDLGSVNFTNADLSGANLQAAKSLAGITWTGATCPDGQLESMGVPGCEDQL